MTTAVEVRDLGKRYEIGEREQYVALRDVIARMPRQLARRVRANGRSSRRPHAWALRHVSFDVEPGEVLGVIGRNGAGKSTLLKVLSRITPPTEGRALLRGRVGSLLEVGSGFHPELTGAENILLNGAILGMHRSEIERRFDDIVEFAGVGAFLKTPVKRYSSGMYMRLAFAVAAHLEPDILVIDEVLAVGDAEFQRKCLGRMSELAGGHGRTVLFVSHNLDAVSQLCRRSIWLDGGELRADGPTARVVEQYLERQIQISAAGKWLDLDDATRTGTGEVRFERVRFTGDGVAGSPLSGGRLAVDVVLRADSRVTIGSLAVTIGTLGGTLLVSADPVVPTLLGLDLEPGVHRFLIAIDAVHLVPGTYAMGLWLARGQGGRSWSIYDWIDQATHVDFEVPGEGWTALGQATVPCSSEITRL